jgi:hypothetical protein
MSCPLAVNEQKRIIIGEQRTHIDLARIARIKYIGAVAGDVQDIGFAENFISGISKIYLNLSGGFVVRRLSRQINRAFSLPDAELGEVGVIWHCGGDLFEQLAISFL